MEVLLPEDYLRTVMVTGATHKRRTCLACSGGQGHLGGQGVDTVVVDVPAAAGFVAAGDLPSDHRRIDEDKKRPPVAS